MPSSPSLQSDLVDKLTILQGVYDSSDKVEVQSLCCQFAVILFCSWIEDELDEIAISNVQSIALSQDEEENFKKKLREISSATASEGLKSYILILGGRPLLYRVERKLGRAVGEFWGSGTISTCLSIRNSAAHSISNNASSYSKYAPNFLQGLINACKIKLNEFSEALR